MAKPPIVRSSEAAYVKLTEDYRVPASVAGEGFEYLIGAEDLRDLLAFASSKQLSSGAVAEFIIHYALYDCAPAWINDVPDRT